MDTLVSDLSLLFHGLGKNPKKQTSHKKGVITIIIGMYFN